MQFCTNFRHMCGVHNCKKVNVKSATVNADPTSKNKVSTRLKNKKKNTRKQKRCANSMSTATRKGNILLQYINILKNILQILNC